MLVSVIVGTLGKRDFCELNNRQRRNMILREYCRNCVELVWLWETRQEKSL